MRTALQVVSAVRCAGLVEDLELLHSCLSTPSTETGLNVQKQDGHQCLLHAFNNAVQAPEHMRLRPNFFYKMAPEDYALAARDGFTVAELQHVLNHGSIVMKQVQILSGRNPTDELGGLVEHSWLPIVQNADQSNTIDCAIIEMIPSGEEWSQRSHAMAVKKVGAQWWLMDSLHPQNQWDMAHCERAINAKVYIFENENGEPLSAANAQRQLMTLVHNCPRRQVSSVECQHNPRVSPAKRKRNEKSGRKADHFSQQRSLEAEGIRKAAAAAAAALAAAAAAEAAANHRLARVCQIPLFVLHIIDKVICTTSGWFQSIFAMQLALEESAGMRRDDFADFIEDRTAEVYTMQEKLDVLAALDVEIDDLHSDVIMRHCASLMSSAASETDQQACFHVALSSATWSFVSCLR